MKKKWYEIFYSHFRPSTPFILCHCYYETHHPHNFSLFSFLLHLLIFSFLENAKKIFITSLGPSSHATVAQQCSFYSLVPFECVHPGSFRYLLSRAELPSCVLSSQLSVSLFQTVLSMCCWCGAQPLEN